jgi:hypothetical protein
MTKTAPPAWLLAFWKEIDDKTFGKGFECFAEDATCNLGVADWHGREQIRENLRAFIDTGFTALHDVVEYWDGGSLKVFRGTSPPFFPKQLEAKFTETLGDAKGPFRALFVLFSLASDGAGSLASRECNGVRIRRKYKRQHRALGFMLSESRACV